VGSRNPPNLGSYIRTWLFTRERERRS
jgi:hypothetical protein